MAFNIESNSIIDIHTHAGVDVANFVGGRYPFAQSVQDMALKAVSNGVRWLVVFPMPSSALFFTTAVCDSNASGRPTERFPYEHSNSVLLGEVERFGLGMCWPFMAIDPNRCVDAQLGFLELVVTRGATFGLKLHTAATDSSPIDLIRSPFMDLLRDHNLPITIHCSVRHERLHPRRIVELAEEHQDVRSCIAHLARLDRDVLTDCAQLSNVFVDGAPFLSLCEAGNKGIQGFVSGRLFETDYSDSLQCLVDLFGALPDRLMWGTDEPWTTRGDFGTGDFAGSSYAEECGLLNLLRRSGRESVVTGMTNRNSLRFLFGDRCAFASTVAGDAG